MAHILLVEDDENLGFLVKDNLETGGHEVTLITNGNTGLEKYNESIWDLVILDIMLPGIDGFTIGQEIRKNDQRTPIMFLTARSSKEDRIKGLRYGADDYLTKPFSMEELLLRVAAILKRMAPFSPETLSIGDYQFIPNDCLLENNDKSIQLTAREAEVLQLLATSINHVVERERILVSIWGQDDYFMGRSLDVFISRLRKHLEDDTRISIQNVHGVGFKLVVEEAGKIDLNT